MSINLKQLKQSEIRKELKYKEDTILIKNPTFEQKELIFQKIQEYILKADKDNNEIYISDKELIIYIFQMLVDGIDFNGLSDDEIGEIFDNPIPILFEILEEISKVSQEICEEAYNGFETQLNSIDKMIETQVKNNKIENFVKKYEGKELNNKTISKPKPKKSREKKVVEDNATI